MKPFGVLLLFCFMCKISSLPTGQQPNETEFGGRIVGGSLVDISNRKFQVAVLPGSYLCGGSLIKLNWVVTAAHCTYGHPTYDVTVRAGSNYHDYGGVVRGVLKIIEHRSYMREYHDYDISLLQLVAPFYASRTIGTIGLASTSPYVGTWVVVSGYGTTSYGGSNANQLMQTTLLIKSFEACNEAYFNSLTDHMICAALPGQDSCQGDSGGPLTYNGYLLGVVSFGEGCASPDYPGVYTSIAKLRDWIEDNMN